MLLEQEALKTIIEDWSFHTHIPKAGLTRQVALPSSLQPDLALLIQGVRRGGKSTLLTQLPGHYGLPLSHCYFCNFEDPRLLNDLNFTLLDQIIAFARKQHLPAEKCYFFFDEIQNVEGWEKWLHMQLERPKNNYFVLTGSNSCLLSGEFATALTGRHITLDLFPFSFAEYKTFCPDKNLADYLVAGGFPRSLTFEYPYQLLQEYFNDIIYRDVVKRVKARSPDSIKQVVKMAFETCGSELSFRKIAAVTGLSVDTVKSYLEAAEYAYLLFACPYFSFSEKKQLGRQKKYYPIDTGLRHAITNTSHRDFGKSLESLVFLYLKQNYENVYYWQEPGLGEVDFVAIQGSTITPFQVTWEKPESRHEKALLKFYEYYPQANEVIFITKDNASIFLSK
jgi:predicted AAA+ superfamily ATPase